MKNALIFVISPWLLLACTKETETGLHRIYNNTGQPIKVEIVGEWTNEPIFANYINSSDFVGAERFLHKDTIYNIGNTIYLERSYNEYFYVTAYINEKDSQFLVEMTWIDNEVLEIK